MRIGVNCYLLTHGVGGAKQYFINLFNELLANHNNHIFTFFYFPQNIEELSKLDDTSWKEHAILLKDQVEVKKYLNMIDLYFCPFHALWPRPLPIPTVLFVHDIQEVFYPEFFTQEELTGRQYHYSQSMRMATRIITNSEYTKQTIVRHHHISPNKIIVSHLCADQKFYMADAIASPLNLILPDGDFIFYPANCWAHKNHDTLLRAIKWLKTERAIKINAIFTGSDDLNNRYPLKDKISEYGLDDQVYLVGYVTVEELAYFYTAAKMMVFPSLFEGFGIPLVEAMAAGCPIIASHVTSLPEIGADSVEYVDPLSPQSIGTKIELLLKDKKKRKQLIEKGKRRSKDFPPSKLASVHLRTFNEAVESFSMGKYFFDKYIKKNAYRFNSILKSKNIFSHIYRQIISKII